MLAGSNLNRRRQSQSSVGNHDNSAVVNVSEDELVNNVSSEQQAATKPDNKVGNATVDPSPVEPAEPQGSLEPLLASIAPIGQHLSMVSPSKEGSSSSNGSEDFSRPASGIEPRPTVHSGFELAGQYPSAVVSGGGLPCRGGRGVLWHLNVASYHSCPFPPPSLSPFLPPSLPPSTPLFLQPPVYMLNGIQQHPFAHGTSAPSHHPLPPPAVEFQYQQLMGLHGRQLGWSLCAMELLRM